MGSDKRWVWVKRGEFNERAYIAKDKFPISIMVWGMIALAYKSKLIFIQNTINAEGYIKMLQDNNIIDDAIEYGEMLQKKLGFKNIMYSYIGSIIGSHTGPGLVAVFFHGKDRFK